jgi:predicted site-specific integrase-resolvase
VDDPDRISADDAVRIYKVGKSTLFGWLREGKIKRFKRRGDRRTFVSRRELERFLEFRVVGGDE